MKVLVGVDDDLIFDDVLAALRWCVRTGPDDQVTLLHAKAVFPWMRSAADADAAWAASVTEADERAGASSPMAANGSPPGASRPRPFAWTTTPQRSSFASRESARPT